MTDVLTRRLSLRVWVVVGVVMLGLATPWVEAGAPGDVTFDVQETRAEVGRTRVIAFHVEQGTEDRTTEAVARDKGIVEVIEKPTALAGCTTGYMRIRGLKAGSTVLAIGGAKLKVEVVKARTPELTPETQIIEPASGAVVWGAFAVGVEVDQSGVRSGEDPKIQLRLSTGQKLEPVGVTPLTLGPVRRVSFEVDASSLPAGPLSMWVVEGEEGLDASTYPDGGGDGQRLRVRVVRPESGAVTKIEAEEPFTGERPERFKRPKVAVQNDKDASGGKFVNNASSDPAVCVAFHVDQTGWYQAFVRASGDFGGGAFPTVGLVVDGGQYAATNARLCTKDWHRLALGVPVKLEAGDRVLTPYFLNDFAAAKSDRNLRLDYIELLRVDGPAAGGSGGGGMMEGMAGQAMTGNQPAAADSMMAMNGGAGSGDFAMDDPEGIAPGSPLRIGLSRVLDGQVITGDLVVEGYCWFEGMESNPPISPPLVTVLVNGEPVSKQWAISPRFEIDAGCFKRGKNTLQLTARLGSGALARTPVQAMMWNPPGTAKTERRISQRFTVFDPRWEDIRTRIQREQGLKERTSAAFMSNGEAKLDLPEDLEGSFDLLLEARGQDFKGPAVATIRLKQGDEAPALVKEFAVQGRWDTRKAATVDLKKGPKQLSVAFENDAYEEGKGDRNLFVQSVTLRQVDDGNDKTPPAVAILYPENGTLCYMADAVVATATDNQALAWAELLIDDKPTGMRVDTTGGTGRIVFPLALRSVSPGRHTLTVRAGDNSKNESVSRGIKIRVPEAAPDELSKYDRAVRLLDRFGFGVDPESLAALLIEGEQVWLSDQLSRPFDDPAEATAFGAALARFPNGRGGGDVQRRAILGVLTTPDPARARFVMWTENHFSTWIRKTEGPRKWSEHVAFERLGVAPFEDLLEASSRSPAMLRYLDQENSYATRLNENYAREIMELHCLGVHGGYTQQDVTSLAHLLTGWTVSREGDGRSGGEMSQYIFRFDPTLNDRASIKVIGAEFGAVEREAAYDRVEHVLEVLAAHPSTAAFVSRKLADHYLACPAPEAVVSDLAKVFQQTNGDMKEMLLALAKHPAFWASESGAPSGTFPAQRLAHPQDFAIRLARVSGHINPNHVYEFLGRTGQNFFDRPTPDGYSELDSDYTDSNAMIQRWKFAQDTSNELVNLVPDAWKKDPVLPTPPPAPKGQPPAKPAPIPPEVDAAWAQQVVDVLAIRLTGRVLSASSNDAAIKMLGAIEGKRAERVQKFAPLMAQLPEAHLR